MAGVDPPVLMLCSVVPLDKVVEFPEIEDILVDETPGAVEEFPEVEEVLVVREATETVDELVSVEGTLSFVLEMAAIELVSIVPLAMWMYITLAPESVAVFHSSTSVQASLRKICLVWVMALSGWSRIKIDF